MPATALYDVSINSQGYTLLQESYRKQIQTPYQARFSTGDPSAGDLSFWQHIFQDQFNGGVGQQSYLVKSKSFRTYGMKTEPLRNEMFMSRHPVQVAAFNMTGHASTNGFIRKAKAVSFDGITVIGIPSAVDWAATFSTLGTSGTDTFANKNEMYTVPSMCVELYSRDTSATAGRKGVIVGLHNTVSFNELPTLAATATYTLTGISANSSVVSACQCTADVFAFGTFRPEVADGQVLYFVKFANDTAFTSATTWTMSIPTGHNIPIRMLIDKDGHLWVLTVERSEATPNAAGDIWLEPGGAAAQSRSSHLYRYNAGSLDTDPYVDISIPLPGYVFHDMETLGDSLYLFGERIGEPRSAVADHVIPVVYKVGFGEIFQGYSISASMECSYAFNMGHKILFAVKEDNLVDSTLQPINVYALYPGDQIHCEAQYDSDVASTVFPIGVWTHADNLYLVTNDTEAASEEGIYRFDNSVNWTSNTLNTDKYFVSSIYTADSPLITKYITDVVIKLTRALNTVNQDMQVYIFTDEGTLTSLGSFTSGNIVQTFTASASTTARIFRIVIRSAAAADAVQSGIESIDVRFVPVPLKKYQWSLGLRLDVHAKLHGQGYEAATTSTRLTAIQNAYRSNSAITFIDIEGTSYTCMVTDLIIRAPLIKEQTADQEYICFIELLET